MTTGRHRTRRAAGPAPDPQQRPVLLHYAATGWPPPRGWSERLALVAGAIAVLAAIGTATLTGAWAGFSLLGSQVEPARPAPEEVVAEAADPPPPTGSPTPTPDDGPIAAPPRTTAPAPARQTGPSSAAPAAVAPSPSVPHESAPPTAAPPRTEPAPAAAPAPAPSATPPPAEE